MKTSGVSVMVVKKLKRKMINLLKTIMFINLLFIVLILLFNLESFPWSEICRTRYSVETDRRTSNYRMEMPPIAPIQVVNIGHRDQLSQPDNLKAEIGNQSNSGNFMLMPQHDQRDNLDLLQHEDRQRRSEKAELVAQPRNLAVVFQKTANHNSTGILKQVYPSRKTEDQYLETTEYVVKHQFYDSSQSNVHLEGSLLQQNKDDKNDWETEVRGNYTIIKNYIPADNTPEFHETVTLTTQGTSNYLDHVEVLCVRWDGPISLTVYAPGDELAVAVRKILYLRYCGEPCVSTNVSLHLLYDTKLGPPPSELGTPYEIADMNLYQPMRCSEGKSTLNLIANTIEEERLPYPINVARNVARLAARTYFVFASDIELYPSLNIVPRFMRMLAKSHQPNQVYPLPVFEVRKGEKVPDTKTKLLQMFAKNEAIHFHKYVCNYCHTFPGRNSWMSSLPENDSLSVFSIIKRQKPYNRWEPFYISSNSVPLFDERLSWNGKLNKMTQAYELCVLDYDFCVLDNAFLVHAPGIKTIKETKIEQVARSPFMYKNNAIYRKFLRETKAKYGYKKDC